MSTSQTTRGPRRYGPLAVGLLVVVLLLFFYQVVEIVALVIVAVLFAIYLDGVTAFFQRRLGRARWLGLPLALVVTAVGLSGLGWLIIPPVVQQVRDLLATLPSTTAGWTTYLLDLSTRYPVLGSIFPDVAAVEAQIDSVQTELVGQAQQLIPYLFSGVGTVIHLVSVVVMAIYLTLRPQVYCEGLLRLVPVQRRRLARSILTELGMTLRAWIGAQMVAMVILAALTYAGLLLLDVPFALAFGVFTGVAVVVPFFGTLVSTILPAIFVLGLGDPLRAFLVLMLGIVVHLVEANVVHPLIMERQVNLPPVLSIVSVLVMGKLFGPEGLLLAVPVLSVLVVLVRRIYVEEILERRRGRRPKKEEPVLLAPSDGRESTAKVRSVTAG
jgi:predicted PurR-regulated permease PerM